MWILTIRFKKNDEVGGKRLQNLIMDFLMKTNIEGATVWTGVDGFANAENQHCTSRGCK